MNGYKAYYRGRIIEVHANTALAVRDEAARQFKARKAHEVAVVLCEKDGETVVHNTSEF